MGRKFKVISENPSIPGKLSRYEFCGHEMRGSHHGSLKKEEKKVYVQTSGTETLSVCAS